MDALNVAIAIDDLAGWALNNDERERITAIVELLPKGKAAELYSELQTILRRLAGSGPSLFCVADRFAAGPK